MGLAGDLGLPNVGDMTHPSPSIAVSFFSLLMNPLTRWRLIRFHLQKAWDSPVEYWDEEVDYWDEEVEYWDAEYGKDVVTVEIFKGAA